MSEEKKTSTKLPSKYKPPQAAYNSEFFKILIVHTVNSAHMVCSKQCTFLAFFIQHLHGGPPETENEQSSDLQKTKGNNQSSDQATHPFWTKTDTVPN